MRIMMDAAIMLGLRLKISYCLIYLPLLLLIAITKLNRRKEKRARMLLTTGNEQVTHDFLAFFSVCRFSSSPSPSSLISSLQSFLSKCRLELCPYVLEVVRMTSCLSFILPSFFVYVFGMHWSNPAQRLSSSFFFRGN